MAAEKFSFWISFYESLKGLPPEDFKKIISAMCEKAFYDNEIELEGNLKALFTLIKPVIEKSLRLSNIRSEQGKKGGRPRKEKANESKEKLIKANESNKEPNKKEKIEKKLERKSEKKDINDNSEQSSISKKKEPFHKPNLLEIRAYCSEHNYCVNPEAFFNYYESNGWKVGKNPMKDWKAAVRTWHCNERKTGDSSKNFFTNGQLINQYSKEDFSKLEEQLLDN